MPPVFIQGPFHGGNGPRANPHKIISDRKRKVDAFRDAFVAIGRTEEKTARKVASHVAAIQASAAKCKKVEADLEPDLQATKALESEISGILNSPGMMTLLKDPDALPEVAGQFADDVGRQLLTLSSAYVGTQAYMDMAVSHSQQVPDITGHTAARLAHELETLRINHQRAIEEKDETMAALRKDLAMARHEATSSSALAQEREAAWIKQKVEAEEQRKTARTALDRWEQANKDMERRRQDMKTLESVLEDEIQKRSELSKENTSLITANESLVQDTYRLRKERDKARIDTDVMVEQVACLLRLHSVEKEVQNIEVDEQDRLMRKVEEATELAKTEMLKQRREAATRLMEAEHAKAAAEAEVDRLRRVVGETDTKLFQQSQVVARLEVEAAGLNKAITSRGQRISALDKTLASRGQRISALDKTVNQQNATICQRERQLRRALQEKDALQSRLTDVERESYSLQAVAEENTACVQAEVAKTKVAMDQLRRTRVESAEAVAKLQVQCSRLEDEKKKLILDLDVLEIRRATADKLSENATVENIQLSARLNESAADMAELKIRFAAKDGEARALERKMAKETAEFTVRWNEAAQKGEAKFQEAQELANRVKSQLERETQDKVHKWEGAVAELKGSLTQANTNLAAEKARCTQAATDLAAVRESLAQANTDMVATKAHHTRVETELAGVRRSLAQAKAYTVAEKERVTWLEQDRQEAFDALVDHFSATLAPSPIWTRFAIAAQTPGLCHAPGAAPSLWALQLWDRDEAPVEPCMRLCDLYAALCHPSWSACVLHSLSRFTSTLAHTESIHVASTQLLADSAFRALETPDVAPVAHLCGLAIWQLFAVLRRWPALAVPSVEDVASRLPEPAATLVADLAVDQALAPSPNRLDHGSLSLVSQPGSLVGFIVDKHLGLIRAVHKTRCVWENGASVRIHAPNGQDGIVIPLDSDATADWLLEYWLVD